MKTNDKTQVAETLKEQPTKIKVGWFAFNVKPLTLMQIYEMSVFANDIKKPTWKDGSNVNIISETIAHGNDAKLMCEVFIVCAFRKSWKRILWGHYIRKHLDITAFNQLVSFISHSFNANFFLTSITFLTQTTVMTEPRTIPHGQQSEE